MQEYLWFMRYTYFSDLSSYLILDTFGYWHYSVYTNTPRDGECVYIIAARIP